MMLIVLFDIPFNTKSSMGPILSLRFCSVSPSGWSRPMTAGLSRHKITCTTSCRHEWVTCPCGCVTSLSTRQHQPSSFPSFYFSCMYRRRYVLILHTTFDLFVLYTVHTVIPFCISGMRSSFFPLL